MINPSRVFVSYTTRDGYVTPELLRLVENNLREICSPYIHATTSSYEEIGQFDVRKKLFSSHVMILIESSLVEKSPWVRFELFLAKLMLMPIIRINVDQISSTIAIGLTAH